MCMDLYITVKCISNDKIVKVEIVKMYYIIGCQHTNIALCE